MDPILNDWDQLLIIFGNLGQNPKLRIYQEFEVLFCGLQNQNPFGHSVTSHEFSFVRYISIFFPLYSHFESLKIDQALLRLFLFFSINISNVGLRNQPVATLSSMEGRCRKGTIHTHQDFRDANRTR